MKWKSLSSALVVLFAFPAIVWTSEAEDGEAVRERLVSAWTRHMALRADIQYDFEGRYQLPESVKDRYETKRLELLSRTGVDSLPNQDHVFSGHYSRKGQRRALVFDALAERDGRQLESTYSCSDGTSRTLRSLLAERETVNAQGAKVVRHLSKPDVNFEREVEYLRGAEPFLDWLEKTNFTVEEKTDSEMGACYVLNYEYEGASPGGDVWTYSDEVWISRDKGLLPFRWNVGPGLREGVAVKPPFAFVWGITEARPGEFLISSLDADMPTEHYAVPPGKFQVRLSNIRVGPGVDPGEVDKILATRRAGGTGAN